jgi:hypothetical protein
MGRVSPLIVAALICASSTQAQPVDSAGRPMRVPTVPSLAPPKPPQPVKRENVYAQLAAFTGEFTVDAWVNQRNARFWTNVRVSGRDLVLPVTFDNASQWVAECYAKPNCANHSHEWLGYIILNNHGTVIDKSYAAEITSAFNGLVETLQTPLTTVQRNDVSLKNFTQVGRNTVQYKVMPHSPVWSVLIQLYTVDTAGKPTVIQETYLDNKTGGAAPVITLNVTK